MQIDPYVDPKSLSVNNIPSIRFGAGFLTRTFARLVKELVDIARDIADRQKGVHDKEKERGSKDIQVTCHWGELLEALLCCLQSGWDHYFNALNSGLLSHGSRPCLSSFHDGATN